MIQEKTLIELINDGTFNVSDIDLPIDRYFRSTGQTYAGLYSVSRAFREHFATWRPVSADPFVWYPLLQSRAAVVGLHLDPIMSQYNKLVESFVTTGGTITRDSTRTIKSYPAPNGNPNTAYVTSMGTDGFTETETETGKGDENIERLTQLDQINNILALILKEFETLFIGRWAI